LRFLESPSTNKLNREHSAVAGACNFLAAASRITVIVLVLAESVGQQIRNIGRAEDTSCLSCFQRMAFQRGLHSAFKLRALVSGRDHAKQTVKNVKQETAKCKYQA